MGGGGGGRGVYGFMFMEITHRRRERRLISHPDRFPECFVSVIGS